MADPYEIPAGGFYPEPEDDEEENEDEFDGSEEEIPN